MSQAPGVAPVTGPSPDPAASTRLVVRDTAAPWWRTAVVYQVYPRSFADSDGDGVGDLRGLTSRLDYLSALGVDVVWLSPIYCSPQHDNGYDISDYTGIDPVFGTLEDFDALVAGLHSRGMRLLMDLVVNHTSDEHPWFTASRASRDSPMRDWYWWRPARPGCAPGTLGAEPTNWRSAFSGPAWTLDEKTGEYYLHLFSRKQPDLNWENPEVRQAVHTMMRWWLDRGVDGFRMDVVNFISKAVAADGSLPDAPASDGSPADGRAFYINGPRIHEYLAELNVEVLAGRDLMTVGEMPDCTVAQAVRYTSPRRREVDMVFTFEHVELDQKPGGLKWDAVPLRLTDLKTNLTRWQEGLADEGWNSLYWNNHDQPRVVSRWGDDGTHRIASAKTLGTTLHMLRGTPFVYQGEELGMTNAHFISLDAYRDVESLNWVTEASVRGVAEKEVLAALAIKSRDNSRTPMQWDGSSQAGFTSGTPWLPVNANHRAVNAAAALADPSSVFHHYRRLIELRHQLPIVVDGRFRLLLPADEQLFAYVRETRDQALLVVANWSDQVVAIDRAELGDDARLLAGDLLLGTHGSPPAGAPLAPWESRILSTEPAGRRAA